jgi:glycosyltransferase involved in cell wall biosynthesis
MTYSLGDMRKNAQDAMMSWHRVLGDDDRYELVIKCRDNPMWLTNCTQPGVTIVRGEQSADDYQALMNRAAVFMFPSRGEGFGLPPREAVLMGIPTIATQWLGLWDVNQWGFPVSVLEMWPSQFDGKLNANAADSLWVNISRQHLDAQLRWIINNYEAALEHTWKGREYLLANFTWKRTAADILDILDA